MNNRSLRHPFFLLTTTLLLGFLLLGCAAEDQAGSQASKDPSFAETLQKTGQNGQLMDTPQDKPRLASPGGVVVPFANVKVDKAQGDNSFTVGELFAKGAELNGQTILVRGQVVRFSPAIMNRNFIHLQDGSGDPAQNFHNLVVTSNEVVQVGDILTFKGVLAANRDFGMGYHYLVIVEEASIVN